MWLSVSLIWKFCICTAWAATAMFTGFAQRPWADCQSEELLLLLVRDEGSQVPDYGEVCEWLACRCSKSRLKCGHFCGIMHVNC